ncbi:DegV family protein [Mycobacterium sp. 1164985.4]|uniref:DegV family protein n=1 Tax=Mycobacterium sp. 1164985.4 TaxID=1834069 RepID=UPI0007FEC941|nr:DegV family protein [Mycobacterium sp. 1164985.4]OBK79219.1 hypothetical protein A5650_08380 [Mycobacterium sp. 1164985.4]
MADVAVVTDSTSCLPGALVERLGITVVSLYYNVGGGWLRESDFDGDFAQFYEALDASRSVAATSPPTADDFVAVFDSLLRQHSAVVAVLISSGLSETCSLARHAAATFGDDGERVEVIDSAGTAGHLGVQAMAAAHAAAEGQDKSGVTVATRRARHEVRQWFVVDTLEYLRRGGRIGGAAAWLGSALDLKPILMVGSEFRAIERVRTRRRAVERLVELMHQRRAVGAERYFINHADAYEDAMRLAQRLRELFGSEPEFISELGPVVATNGGPGVLAVGSVPGAAMGYALG